MTNFRINFSHPWLLLLLIPAALLTLLPYFRAAKKYRRTRNRILSMAFHMIAMVLAINLLAGITFSYELPNLENEVILLVDSTDSGTGEDQSKEEFVGSVINICDNDYKLGIVKFGYDQKYVVELSHNTSGAFEQYMESDDPDTTATDIASAIKYASTLFTNKQTAKIVILSDGIETDNAAVSVIKAVAAEGIKVDTVHFPNESHGEMQIVNVKTPEQGIILGEEFITEMTIKSNLGTEQQAVVIRAYDNGELIGETVTMVNKEEETLSLGLVIEERGMHEFSFEISTPNDTVLQNNSYRTFINLEAFENILLIERKEDEGKRLAELLDVTYNVTSLSLDEDLAAIPKSVEELVDFEQVILVNVAYSDMPAGFEEALNEYVYNLGGGLFTVGGPNDTVGGTLVPHAYNRNDIANSTYFKQMLPINAIDYTPPIAVMIVVDTSASMSMGKLPAAVQGAEACLDSLNDRDFCGVMTFQTRASEELSILPVSQRDTIRQTIKDIESDTTASGGTIFSDAIMRAGRALSVIENVERKHIIMVTDGNPGDSYETYLPYIQDNVKDGITMSIITVGSIDASLKEKMNNTATEGGGKFYNIPDGEFQKIPEYMQTDLALEAIAEIAYGEEFIPTINDRTSVLAGIEQADIPPLTGYYGTVAKNGAAVPLMGKYVPIYAQWQYGKGNVGSFMCDLSGIWSDKFMSDSVGQTIISNIINCIFPMEDVRVNDLEYVIKTDNYTTQLSIHGALENENVVVEVTPLSESLISVLEDGVAVKVAEPNRRYTFVIKDPGLYEIKIKKLDAAGALLSEQVLYKTFSYSEEYNYFPERIPLGAELLSILALDGKGMEVEDPATVFESFSKTLKKEVDPRIVFLILAIIFVLLDIAVRKFKFKWPHELVREYKQRKAERESQK